MNIVGFALHAQPSFARFAVDHLCKATAFVALAAVLPLRRADGVDHKGQLNVVMVGKHRLRLHPTSSIIFIFLHYK